MSLAVIRCPVCKGASRVPADALGQMVACPRCQAPFVAAEDVPTVAPVRPEPRPEARVARDPDRPDRPRRPRRPRSDERPESEFEPRPDPDRSGPHDPEHDPHAAPVGGVPVSVMVGFALMPFAIPLLWLVGPIVTGREAALSLAVPVSLAFAAAVLCLGVVYTIDWTAGTRIKGVFMLVALAYLSAAGLYFLKKDLMDQVRAVFGPSNHWTPIESPDGKYRVKMPNPPLAVNEQPLGGLVVFRDGHRAVGWADRDAPCQFVVLASAPDPRGAGGDEWFKRVGDRLQADGGRPAGKPEGEPVTCGGWPGRQWVFEARGDVVRVVRVCTAHGRVYYLCVEGPGLDPKDDPLAKPFFESFDPIPPK